MNKRLVLLLILALTMATLGGCTKQIEAPEGVRQEFYDDMIGCLKKLEKYKGDEDNNGIDVVKYYLDNKTYLNTTKELKIIDAMDNLYLDMWIYHEGAGMEDLMIKDSIKTVINLMELDININKLLSK